MHRQQEHLRLTAVVAEVEDVLHQGADLEITAVMYRHGQTLREAYSGGTIFVRGFEWAECHDCDDRRYSPAECEVLDWSIVAGPRCGFGGKWLICPSGHVIFSRQTWVS